MRVFSIYKPDPTKVGAPPTGDVMKLIEDMTKSGVLLATEGFVPSPKDVRVRLSAGKFTVTDGPFTEAKELIGGFALLRVESMQEAVEHSRRFLETMGGGECEMHQLGDMPALPIEKVAR
jgi:hypothetical protein